MEKEDKEILLRDLCARLPYGVKVKTPNDDEVYTLLSLNPNKGIAVIGMPFNDFLQTFFVFFGKNPYICNVRIKNNV